MPTPWRNRKISIDGAAPGEQAGDVHGDEQQDRDEQGGEPAEAFGEPAEAQGAEELADVAGREDHPDLGGAEVPLVDQLRHRERDDEHGVGVEEGGRADDDADPQQPAGDRDPFEAGHQLRRWRWRPLGLAGVGLHGGGLSSSPRPRSPPSACGNAVVPTARGSGVDGASRGVGVAAGRARSREIPASPRTWRCEVRRVAVDRLSPADAARRRSRRRRRRPAAAAAERTVACSRMPRATSAHLSATVPSMCEPRW